MLKYVLFDLDGTLTDSGLGITKAAQYALKDQGIDEPDISKLGFFVGPPLNKTFMEHYGMDEKHMLRAVDKFREYYNPIGVYENKPYEGVEDMLKACHNAGLKLAIASSKPQVMVYKVLNHFGLTSYFDVIIGSELDGRRTDKNEVVEEALRRLMANADETAMVGDRCYDMVGACNHDLMAIGVTYGYGTYLELKNAGAEKIVDTVQDLKNCLLASCGALQKCC
ncbi:phosphoglycolate phosphatase [Butyrivibrio fibrisolvens DSM 3071]|jgi:phosphoglycolate phosphatase|uniref:Phosphoglycolate phosphatase n=1 Tax=Butyrivibrio fibrisolvens DSM 3071 TaxID=1121131 RepID=A0A1M5ZU80_BUTFI|nr:HAD hydrolase-like protein [Butyrivibrio fibrisolvens]SHI27804.1 phosphoglycolate phosphatase [Butyrivibrio fibrisolvens DSM 3071]